ncbi:hypothetical protein CYMTET_42073 [Cymbomonas tetramitiformis]|uniref:Uncharacterized protein n=1 Tax=Cymbomonas tetramitiformis TaxID=36881 RepID=A0AAE0C6J7_9CHLO|nr:hypothetical protein CYMTET_42073 [Cymbomonas tetramitiformis]
MRILLRYAHRKNFHISPLSIVVEFLIDAWSQVRKSAQRPALAGPQASDTPSVFSLPGYFCALPFQSYTHVRGV